MKCLEIQHRMAAFIENQLDERDTEEFVAHIEGCESCREELAIQYLITEGMRCLEDGSAFDLNKELEEKLQLTLKRMRYKKNVNRMMLSLEAASIVVVAILSIFVLY